MTRLPSWLEDPRWGSQFLFGTPGGIGQVLRQERLGCRFSSWEIKITLSRGLVVRMLGKRKRLDGEEEMTGRRLEGENDWRFISMRAIQRLENCTLVLLNYSHAIGRSLQKAPTNHQSVGLLASRWRAQAGDLYIVP